LIDKLALNKANLALIVSDLAAKCRENALKNQQKSAFLIYFWAKIKKSL